MGEWAGQTRFDLRGWGGSDFHHSPACFGESQTVETLGEFFHRVVDMLPWRQESDKQEAHTAVEDVVVPAFGRNATPAGVVKPDEPPSPDETPDKTPDKTPDNTPTPGGFPQNPTPVNSGD